MHHLVTNFKTNKLRINEAPACFPLPIPLPFATLTHALKLAYYSSSIVHFKEHKHGDLAIGCFFSFLVSQMLTQTSNTV